MNESNVYSKKVATIGPPKEAALYFDEVLPIDFGTQTFTSLPRSSKILTDVGRDIRDLSLPVTDFDLRHKVLQSLLPNSADPNALYHEQTSATMWFAIAAMLSTFDKKMLEQYLDVPEQRELTGYVFSAAGIDPEKAFDSILSGEYKPKRLAPKFSETVDSYVKSANFRGAPAWKSLAPTSPDQNYGTEAGYAMAVSSLNLIDVKKVSWETIVEFRSDPEAMDALRRFRLFFADSFKGKELSYVEDRLATALDDYKETTKLWGFDTIRKTVSVAASNQNVVNSSIALAATGLTGAPLPVAAAAGTVVTLAGCGVKFFEIFHDARLKKSKSPINFLSRIEDLEMSREED